jgi:glycosyltransferase involved in cell wall biosynthesis
MPFFSVIIPLYNKENFIENTLKSVFAQTFEDYEILIVEDCSTDNSLNKISGLISSKVRIIKHEKNKGLSASRNTGIANANSEYIAFLDADDIWKSTFLQELKLLIDTYPEAKLFGTNYEETYSENNIILPKNNSDSLEKHSVIPDFFAISLAQPLYCPSSFCVHKSVFETIGYYNESITYGEDVDFNIRANSKFKLAYSTNHFISYTTSSENQITKSNISEKTITDFDAYENDGISDSLKKFLDFKRYMMAKHYRLENNEVDFIKMKRKINAKNLNFKQRFLLNSPKQMLNVIRSIKSFFISKGIRFTTYD